jgi:glycosyltransferase involved in cell wall biosynthesis
MLNNCIIPLFSVLVANYNNGKYLVHAINSVKEQTYKNWEIIIVDDASTDNSKEIYKLYNNDNRIKVFYNDRNYGCGFTVERCIKMSKGELCGRLDPDDVLLPTALEDMVKGHLEHYDASMIYSKLIFCDNNLNKLYVFTTNHEEIVRSDYLHVNSGVSHFVSFKKLYYNKTEGIDIHFKRAVDQDMFYKLEEVGKLYCIDKPHYLYRVHANGISTGNNVYKALFWHIKAIDAACRRRKIIEDAEDIVHHLIYNDFIMPLKREIDKPSLKFVLIIIYRFFRKYYSRIFSLVKK